MIFLSDTTKRQIILSICVLLLGITAYAQPEPCGVSPAMTSLCNQACVICDIDGYSGVNDLTATGQGFPEFCTTQYNNMQYIGFFAGSENLSIRVDVGSCSGGVNSLEVGFFYTEDCQNFEAISFCDTDIEGGQSTTFNNNQPLVIGQHYYLVIDGSGGANCSWTFNVLEGTTAVEQLTTSGVISNPLETCPGVPTTFSTTGEVGAAFYRWTVDGVIRDLGFSKEVELTFDAEGEYEVCVTGENVCDEAPPSCTTIKVREIENLSINERLCDGECILINGNDYCNTGTFQEIVRLPSGCDSIIDIELIVLPQARESIDLWICNDDFYFIGPNAYNTTGSFQDTILTLDACDSIVSLELRVIECEIIGTSDQIPVICNGTATGTLVFSVDQGEPPLEFTYTNIFEPTLTGSGMTNLLIDNEIPGIPAGTYQIYITDDFGNDVVVVQEVEEPSLMGLALEPSVYGDYNVSCYSSSGLPGRDGTLRAEPSGGYSPYTYLWSDGQTTQQAVDLTYQDYSVTVTDSVGCSIEASYTLTSSPEIISDIIFNDPTCAGLETGVIDIVNTSGGLSPYTYALNNLNFSNDTIWTELAEGSYEVFIEDAYGCIVSTVQSITAPEIPVVSFANELTLSLGDSLMLEPIVNDISIQNILWSPTENLSCIDCIEPAARPVNDTAYTVTITSQDDCERAATISVNINQRRRVYIPTVFSPTTPLESKFLINAGLEVEEVLEFNIYDRWGSLIFSQNNFKPNDESFGWDGRVDGIPLNNGIYVWQAKILFIDSEVLDYTGSVSMLK